MASSAQEKAMLRVARDKRVAGMVAEMLCNIASGECQWKDKSFVIGKGPSQSALFDSHKVYPFNQRIGVRFGITIGGSGLRQAHLYEEVQARMGKLLYFKAYITAMHWAFLPLSQCRRQDQAINGDWLIVAEVIDGELKGKIMVGTYNAGSRLGGCTFVD